MPFLSSTTFVAAITENLALVAEYQQSGVLGYKSIRCHLDKNKVGQNSANCGQFIPKNAHVADEKADSPYRLSA